MNRELALLTHALNNLPSHICVETPPVPRVEGNQDLFSDAKVVLKNAKQTLSFDAEIKRIHRKESLSNLIRHTNENRLLVCNTLSPFLADYCSEHQLNFIDEAGNARISIGGFNLWIEGRHLTNSPSQANSSQTRPGEGVLKLIFTILVNKDSLQLPYRNLAMLAGISLGMVSKGFEFLTAAKLVSKGKKRRLLDDEALYRLWFNFYPSVLRPKLGGIRLKAPHDWKEIPVNETDCWGGEVAADQLTAYLSPYEYQLFTFEPLQKKIAALKTTPTADGKFWLVPAFWGPQLEITTKAKALLATAELLASKDSRNLEVAELINDKYLHVKAPIKAGI